jgi:NADPH2:quinone reductase
MPTTYRAVMLTGKGGPEVLREVDLPLAEPGPGEVRIAVSATGAGGTDILMRRGFYPYAPRKPFVPGYEVVGVVEALGAGVSAPRIGQRVAALVVHGGYAEKLVRPADQFVPVPDNVDDATAVALILNYATAWQAIHRIAKVKPGDSGLVAGATGGVGTAMLEVLRLIGARTIGAAGVKRHDLVRSLGATPVDARSGAYDAAVRRIVPQGVDITFDNLGGRFAGQNVRATRKGGLIVGIGFAATGNGFTAVPVSLAQLFGGALLAGRRATFFGITQLYRKDPLPFREDLANLFALAGSGAIKPRIAARLPLLAARQAAEMMERGGSEGKIVHLAANTEPAYTPPG